LGVQPDAGTQNGKKKSCYAPFRFHAASIICFARLASFGS
jgi:hypothetical protein